jgi:hypothetical protein
MVKTHGLMHIALKVRDPERSPRFYEQCPGELPWELRPGAVLPLAEYKSPRAATGRGGTRHYSGSQPPHDSSL